MQIILNKQSVEIPEGMSLQDLAVSQGLEGKCVAVAVNFNVIRREHWGQHLLCDGDNVTVIGIAKGG